MKRIYVLLALISVGISTLTLTSCDKKSNKIID